MGALRESICAVREEFAAAVGDLEVGRTHVAEVYSPPRVTQLARGMG